MLAIIRIRGTPGMKFQLRQTLKMLRLDTVNSCTVVSDSPDYRGMVKKVKDAVTWGEIDKETLQAMLEKRLRLKGNKRVDEKILKKVTNHTYESLTEALMRDKVKLKDFKEFQPIFRLTPPSKGFRSIKLAYPKGDLGYRGMNINKLILRMI
jgi:large subunit ribosomal protein L30